MGQLRLAMKNIPPGAPDLAKQWRVWVKNLGWIHVNTIPGISGYNHATKMANMGRDKRDV